MGSGSEMYTPLATAVIGGLLTSTMLTLFIVPVVYVFFDNITGGAKRDLARATMVEPSIEAAETSKVR
jgi:hypothetical protein